MAKKKDLPKKFTTGDLVCFTNVRALKGVVAGKVIKELGKGRVRVKVSGLKATVDVPHGHLTSAEAFTTRTWAIDDEVIITDQYSNPRFHNKPGIIKDILRDGTLIVDSLFEEIPVPPWQVRAP